MLRRIFTFLLVLGLAALLVTPAAAQSYDFSMDKVDANVYWNADGTMSLDYLLTYTNQPGGHVIDFVDVGMPTNSFDLSSARADINGNPLSLSSDFQGPSGYGFAVDMGSHAIRRRLPSRLLRRSPRGGRSTGKSFALFKIRVAVVRAEVVWRVVGSRG